ncbi:MAG TPA: HAMP domain-containing sensor histidine kinase, partial [Bacteroidales bacterium]|nr:HAMP domain-containing sensor histidine kinase [Bacteroidales bacterium]
NETEQLITEILVVLALVFLTLLVLLVLVNYFITRRVWVPFYRILNQINRYEIHDPIPLEFTPTEIHEFRLLSTTLETMSKKIRADYMNLREFNENASHELQTPLAIIKSNLEMLVQKENLDEEQYRRISVIMEAITRVSRLNQGLLLISKIDNNQFMKAELVDFKILVEKALAHFEEMIEHRGIVVTRHPVSTCVFRMDPALAEILVNNLISNSIRHNLPGGEIRVSISENSLTIANTGEVLTADPSMLFERFRKSGKDPDSVGLGLSIVNKIANFYNLRVDYSHREGIHTLTVRFR